MGLLSKFKKNKNKSAPLNESNVQDHNDNHLNNSSEEIKLAGIPLAHSQDRGNGVDDASLFGATSSMGDMTKNSILDSNTVMSPGSVYSQPTLNAHQTPHHYEDDGTAVSSVYRRACDVTLDGSVFSEGDSVRGGGGGGSTVAGADDWSVGGGTFATAHTGTSASLLGRRKEEDEDEIADRVLVPHLSNEELHRIKTLGAKEAAEIKQQNNGAISKSQMKRGGISVDGDDSDDDNEPGTLRLTLDGLQQHDMKEAVKEAELAGGVVRPWESGFAVGGMGIGTIPETSPQIHGHHKSASSAKYPGVIDDECVARRMMDLKLEREEKLSKKKPSKKNFIVTDGETMSTWSQLPMEVSHTTSKKIEELKRRERERERENRLKKAMLEAKERDRVKKLKEAELNRQRLLQSEVELRKEKANEIQKRQRQNKSSRSVTSGVSSDNNSVFTGGTGLTGFSNVEVTLEPSSNDIPSTCVVCMEDERTHLAVPCMHFSFCEFCVKDMQSRGISVCPVCNEKDITFSKVFF